MNVVTQRQPRGWTEWPGWPYVLVGVAVLLRLAHIWNARANPTFWAPAVDPAWYDAAAIRITQGDWGPFPLFRAPVYQVLLAGVYSLFGHDLVAARILNVVLQGVTTWMVWHVGRSYFSSAVGVLAAAFFALNGMAIFFAAELVSPSVEMLCAVLVVWTTFRLLRDHNLAAIIVCGLTYGLAAITRPNFLFLYPIPLLLILLRLWGGTGWAEISSFKIRVSTSAAWLIAAFIPILPITAANMVKGGEFVLIATQGGVNFWIGNNPESTGVLAVLPGYGAAWTLEDADLDAANAANRKLSPGEVSKYYYDKGWNFITGEPARAARLMIRKAALFVNRNEISNNKDILYFSRLSPWLPALLWLNFGLLVPLGVMGFIVRWREPVAKITLGLVVLYAASVIMFFITARFRMPVVPWLSWFAAAGAVWVVDAARRRFPVRRWFPVAVMFPVIVLVHMDLWGMSRTATGWARFMEGSAHMRLNQLDSAQAGFRDAIAHGQVMEQALLNMGVVEYRRGNHTGALDWYERARDHSPYSAKPWNNLGIIYDTQGDTARAVEAFRRSLSLSPLADDARENLAGVYFRLGVNALKNGHDSLSIAYFDSSTALHPEPAAFFNRALAWIRLGQNQLADRNLDTAIALDPNLVGAIRLKDSLRRGAP